MDDDLLTARLRALGTSGGDGTSVAEPRPEFVEALHGELAERLGFGFEDAGAAASTRPRRPTSSRTRRWLLIAATIALLIAAGASVAAVGGALERFLDRPTLIDSIQSGGSIRVAVRPDAPQVASAGGVISGFDIDVAEALGSRLGVGVERAVQPVDAILAAGEPSWQLAFPSLALSAEEMSRYVATEPYYRWPVYVVVRRSEAPGFRIADSRLCVVAGSPGEAWASSQPEQIEIVALPDDAACLNEVHLGGVDGAVTNDLLLIDLAGYPDLAALGDTPVTVEPRAVLVPVAVRGSEELAALIDTELAEMRADGTLTELSKRRFGGQDLTQP
jgi:L-cystine transport system substrate-binding protein